MPNVYRMCTGSKKAYFVYRSEKNEKKVFLLILLNIYYHLLISLIIS